MTVGSDDGITNVNNQKKEESSLSVVANQGLKATTSSTTTAASSSPAHHGAANDHPSTTTDLDFVVTSHAVKTLFSIPYHSSNQPLCIAVHNLDGTLLIDNTVTEEEAEEQEQRESSSSAFPRTTKSVVQDRSNNTKGVLPPSIQSLALALTTPSSLTDFFSKSSPLSQPQSTSSEALSMLSNMIQKVRLQEEKEHVPFAAANPKPVREYFEWKFQDMNLLVGSDASIVRTGQQDSSAAVAIRVEEVHHLKNLAQQLHDEQVRNSSSPSAKQSELHNRSYAQALLQQGKEKQQEKKEEETQEGPNNKGSSLNLDQVRLQTCIVPSSGPLGGLLEGRPSMQSSQPTSMPPPSSSSTSNASSPVCVVLDAYLDNIMANVPQLALCLQEKGVIQSVKILQTEEIPSMMMHPSTLDTSNPVDHVARRSETEDLFSPQIMETNASALLRFLKANCTQNNATYLLRREPGDQPDNIQLYDISSISTQRQRKWIWWLATMSYRFALRLRQLECRQDLLPHYKKRAFRDRQRSLYQTTLDLLQDLLDMDGNAHESLVASVREHMADTFLGETDETQETNNNNTCSSDDTPKTQSPQPVMSASSSSPPSPPTEHHSPSAQQQSSQQTQQQPYAKISVDALNKAHDHLVHGIKTLWPVLEKYVEEPIPPRRRKRGRAGSITAESDSSSDNEESPTAMVMQLFGLNYKVINVSLRLAEHHLRNYYSSSAMQALRNAARRMADSASLLEYLGGKEEWTQRLQLQYTWLWEHCGHFARSFASDELWRDRGHACGDDVISVLRDVEAAFSSKDNRWCFAKEQDPLSRKTRGMVSLQSLSAIIAPSTKMENNTAMQSVSAANNMLANERQLQRDKRQVLVASCISYSRAILAFEDMTGGAPPLIHGSHSLISGDATRSPAILNLLRQRLGDACNETGKVLLAALRTLLTSNLPKENNTQQIAAEALLDSAQFWFFEGLEVFGACNDLRNLALLRCNLCQCYKLRANSSFFASKASDGSSHAEVCLQEAADQLQAAHQALGQRDADPMTWDMVSEELAATFLVLAVRRRQSLLGGGNTPVILQALRLSPGKERSIMEPMEQALEIYEQLGNAHQAAAVHYQLALTHSKMWTCQRDEAKTREKLSAAFQQYNMAFAYFSSSLRGNELTFVLLCLDLASLYAAVAGEECLTKALSRCLDTYDAFSQEAIEAARNSKGWLEKMETLASSVEDRVFKLLRSLVKLDSERYKDLYREGLTAKMVKNVPENDPGISNKASKLLAVHDVLVAIRNKFYG